MDTATAIKEANSFFRYSLEDQEEWRVPTRDRPEGDCEDYVNLIAWLVGGGTRWGLLKAIWSRRITWHHASIAGDERLDHMMGRDPKLDLWFDNNWRALMTWDKINAAWGQDRSPDDAIWIDKTPLGRLYVTRKLLWVLIRGPGR